MNCKPNDVVEKFIELRAQGWSFARIGSELDVSRGALIAWSRKHHRQIQNLRELHLDALSEKCHISRANCLQELSEDARRVREELARRDLTDIPTTRLLTMASLLRAEIVRVAGPVRLSQEVTDDLADRDQFINPSVTWDA
jgi:hypothetical protein